MKTSAKVFIASLIIFMICLTALFYIRSLLNYYNKKSKEAKIKGKCEDECTIYIKKSLSLIYYLYLSVLTSFIFGVSTLITGIIALVI